MDISILLAFQYFRNGIGIIFVDFFKKMTFFGELNTTLVFLGIIYWCISKELGTYLMMGWSGNRLVNGFLKITVCAYRPWIRDPRIVPFGKSIDTATGYSFPSGHSTNSVVTYGGISVKSRTKWIKALLWVVPLLVGISRFVVGVHYPTDVVCGWLLGGIVIIVVPFMQKKIKNKLVFFGILLLIGLPGFFYCTSNDYYSGYGILLGAIVSFLFEERFVNFESTGNVLRALLRTAVGGALFMGINTALKIPFSSAFLASGTTLAHIVRTLRYAITIFCVCGLYPMTFKLTNNIWRKK